MGRKERRALARAERDRSTALIAELAVKRKTIDIMTHGITQEDLNNEYRRGWDDGYKAKGYELIKAVYAGVCIALHDEFGFGEMRLVRALSAMHKAVALSISEFDMADEVLRKCGITIDLGDEMGEVVKGGS